MDASENTAGTSTVVKLTPYLSVSNAAAALEFYKTAFGAMEVTRWIDPGNGKIGHAEITLAGRTIMLADDYPEMAALGLKTPQALGATTMQFWIETDNVDQVATRAIAAGARALPSVRQGEKRRRLLDPCGHMWTVSAPE
jgi:PhnB protein